MRESKLIVLLQTFDNTQLKAFDKFIHSPYFNTSEVCIRLWQQVYKHAPSFESNLLDKEKIYKKIYPKENFHDKKLRQLRSRLLKLVEEFMAVENFKKDEFRFKKEIANAYLDKGMKDHFEGKYEQLKKSFDDEKFLTASDLHHKLSLHHYSYFNEHYIKGNSTPNDLAVATQLLDQYYTQQKLLYTIEWITYSNLFNYKMPENIKTFITFLEQKKQEQASSSSQFIFENAIKLLLQENVEIGYSIFIQIKQEFISNYEKLNKTEKIIVLRLLINFCLKASRKGKNLNKSIFQLNQLGLTDGAIFQRGLMTNISFSNIVGTAIKLKEIDWAVNFIKKESYRLYEPQSDSYRSLLEASLYFYKEEYKDCLMLLSNMDSMSHIMMEISKRGLKLRAAFECYLKDENYAPMVTTNIESFNKFLSRKEVVTDLRKDAFSNFVRFLKRLFRKHEKGLDTKEIISMKDCLLRQDIFPIEYKQWLLKHFEVFKKMELRKATP